MKQDPGHPPNEAASPAILKRLEAYPDYKASGVEWLEKIPAKWEVRRLKHVAELNPEALPEDTDPVLEMHYVDIGGVDSLGRIVSQEELTFGSAPSRARRVVRDGDVIVSTVRTYLRAIAPIRKPGPGTIVSTGFAVVRPGDDLFSGYAAHALRAPYFVERVVANSTGVSFPAINETEMATYELALPSLVEQRCIAAYLDRETARIDALVAKKERLIGLLEEQRTALITRTVTKGLDPNAPLKDSGVEWLGRIPASWEVKRLKRLFRVVNGSTPASGEPSYWDGDIPWITPEDLGDLQGTSISEARRNITDLGYRSCGTTLVPAGSLVLSTRAPIGHLAIAGVSLCMNQGCRGLIFRRTDSAIFFYYELIAAQPELESLGQGSTFMELAKGMLEDVELVVPPESEQRAIAAFLDAQTASIDVLATKVRDAIERLNELRTALISAAVTGKIDVREADVE